MQNLNEIHSNVLNMLEELNNVNNINNESIKLINMFDIYNKIEGDSSKTKGALIQKRDNNFDSQEPIYKDQFQPIIDQMNSCICEIISKKARGTGFFIEFSCGKETTPVLITNNQLVGESDFKKNTKLRISLNNGKDDKYIKLDEQRKRYTNEITDITIIEIKKDDDIDDYLDLDDTISQLLSKEGKSEEKTKGEEKGKEKEKIKPIKKMRKKMKKSKKIMKY